MIFRYYLTFVFFPWPRKKMPGSSSIGLNQCPSMTLLFHGWKLIKAKPVNKVVSSRLWQRSNLEKRDAKVAGCA